jgi:signal transduction histidine kinase
VTRKQQALEMKTGSAERKQNTADRKRVETVVETLATLRGRSETLSEVAHDARNMVTALGLYCDLLDEPGVLATPFMHYGQELKLVAAASRRLVEKIVAIDAHRETIPSALANAPLAGSPVQTSNSQSWATQQEAACAVSPVDGNSRGGGAGDAGLTDAGSIGTGTNEENASDQHSIFARISSRDEIHPGSRRLANSANLSASRRWDLLPAVPVANLAAELLANRNLLAALAGPAIALTVHAEGGARPVRLTGEDLTRVLVNLVKNAAEAMPSGGRIHIGLRDEPAAQGTAECLLVTLEDNGPGIPPDALETIFTSGYSAHDTSEDRESLGSFALSHRGLGLTITRSIVEGAGGRITAGNRRHGGARFRLELPMRTTSH